MISDTEITECRRALWVDIGLAVEGSLPLRHRDTIDALIQFERLDAVAQSSRYISQAAYVRAAAELAEIVTAVLAGDA